MFYSRQLVTFVATFLFLLASSAACVALFHMKNKKTRLPEKSLRQPPAFHDLFSFRQTRPAGMDADQWRTPRPQLIHGSGVLLREGEAKRFVCEERLLRIDGCHHAYP